MRSGTTAEPRRHWSHFVRRGVVALALCVCLGAGATQAARADGAAQAGVSQPGSAAALLDRMVPPITVTLHANPNPVYVPADQTEGHTVVSFSATGSAPSGEGIAVCMNHGGQDQLLMWGEVGSPSNGIKVPVFSGGPNVLEAYYSPNPSPQAGGFPCPSSALLLTSLSVTVDVLPSVPSCHGTQCQ